MTDLWRQFADLTHTNKRLAESRARMVELQGSLKEKQQRGDDISLVEDLVRSLEKTLAQLEEHRSKLMDALDGSAGELSLNPANRVA
jgi:hypothetical protein